MRWTKRRRDEFKDGIDLLLAMADMAKAPSSTVELRDVAGGRNYENTRGMKPNDFQEAEIYWPGTDAFYIATTEDESHVFTAADPRTDLPQRYATSICKVEDGIAGFYKLSSMSIKSLRGQKLLSPYFASFSIYSIDLESGLGAGSVRPVFWAGGKWRTQDTYDRAQLRRLAGLPGEIIDAISDTDPEATNTMCSLLAGITFSRDMQWRVVLKTPEGNSFSITTDSKGAAAAFADRTGDTPSGRRPALRNWVKHHTRKIRSVEDDGSELLKMVNVRKHLRGRIPFSWCGLDCEMVVSPFDLRQSERLLQEKQKVS